jgi:hypothetical protein
MQTRLDSTETASNAAVLRTACAGDTTAWDQIVHRYEGTVRAAVADYRPTPTDAADAIPWGRSRAGAVAAGRAPDRPVCPAQTPIRGWPPACRRGASTRCADGEASPILNRRSPILSDPHQEGDNSYIPFFIKDSCSPEQSIIRIKCRI